MREVIITQAAANSEGFDKLMSKIGPGEADIQLQPGTYVTAGQPDGSAADLPGMWSVRSDWRIRGMGNSPANVVIALGGPVKAGKKWHVLGTDYWSACNFRLENLTINCGFSNHPEEVNFSGVVVRGSNNTIRSVRVCNWGSRLKGSECFGIGLMAVQFHASNNLIEDCRVDEPGGAATETGFTGILHSAIPPFLTLHPVIRNCEVSNLGGNDKTYSNGFTIYNGIRGTIEKCYASDIGSGVFMDDAGGIDLTVSGCKFDRIRRGIQAAFTATGTRQEAITIDGCRFRLLSPEAGSCFGAELNSFRSPQGAFEPGGFGIVKITNNEIIAEGPGNNSYLAAVRGADLLIIRDNTFVNDSTNGRTILGRSNGGQVLLSRNFNQRGGVLSYWDETREETTSEPDGTI